MKIFDNITDIVRDDLKKTIQRSSKVSVAAGYDTERVHQPEIPGGDPDEDFRDDLHRR